MTNPRLKAADIGMWRDHPVTTEYFKILRRNFNHVLETFMNAESANITAQQATMLSERMKTLQEISDPDLGFFGLSSDDDPQQQEDF